MAKTVAFLEEIAQLGLKRAISQGISPTLSARPQGKGREEWCAKV